MSIIGALSCRQEQGAFDRCFEITITDTMGETLAELVKRCLSVIAKQLDSAFHLSQH